MRYGKVVKSGIVYTICNFFTKSIFFLTVPLFTRLMTKSEFGLFNDFLSIQEIMVIIVSLNMEASLISAKYKFNEKYDEYVFSVIFMGLLSCLIFFIAFIFAGHQIEELIGVDKNYLLFMFLYFPAWVCINIFLTREQLEYNYKSTVFVSLGLALVSTIISIVLLNIMNNHVMARIIGLTIPNLILGIILFFVLANKGKRINYKYWRYALTICLPYIPHLLSMKILLFSDRIMITKMCGPDNTALYSLAYICSSIITVFLTSLNNAFLPWLGEQINSKNVEIIKKVSRYYIIAFTYFIIIILLIAPEILWVMGGNAYCESVYIAIPIIIGCYFQFFYSLLASIEQFLGKTYWMAFASVIAAIVNVGLNFIFIPRFGYIAAGYTTMIGYMLLMYFHMFFVDRMNMLNIYDYKIIIVFSLLASLSVFLWTILYNYSLLRFILLITFSICIFWKIYSKREILLNLYKDYKMNNRKAL